VTAVSVVAVSAARPNDGVGADVAAGADVGVGVADAGVAVSGVGVGRCDGVGAGDGSDVGTGPDPGLPTGRMADMRRLSAASGSSPAGRGGCLRGVNQPPPPPLLSPEVPSSADLVVGASMLCLASNIFRSSAHFPCRKVLDSPAAA
jgi:hypothetical protein